MTVALDVAVLLPQEARETAHRINGRFPAGPAGFRFDATHHPHITLGQHFIESRQLDAVCRVVAAAVANHAPLDLRVTGARAGRTAQTLVVAPTPALQRLHEQVLDALTPFEVPGGAAAFQSDALPARAADARWVARFRRDSAYNRFDPHVTVGIGPDPVTTEPFAFTARTIAVCRLGRFCTCRDQLARWTL